MKIFDSKINICNLDEVKDLNTKVGLAIKLLREQGQLDKGVVKHIVGFYYLQDNGKLLVSNKLLNSITLETKEVN